MFGIALVYGAVGETSLAAIDDFLRRETLVAENYAYLLAGMALVIIGLGMGPAIKCVYRFREPLTPPGIKAIYAAGRAPMWWTPSFGHETDAVVWTAFVTGDAAIARYAKALDVLARTDMIVERRRGPAADTEDS